MEYILKLKNEISGKKRTNFITLYETIIAENIIQAIQQESFFSLPLNNIVNIVSQINFSEQDDPISCIKTIISQTIKNHLEEKETVLLLSSVKTNKIELTLDQCVDILSLFTRSNICMRLHKKYQDFKQIVDIDPNYEINEKEKEIQHLKKQNEQQKSSYKSMIISKELQHTFFPIQKRPMFFESDLFKAISKGKLDSVQYLIEKQGVDINQKSIKDNDAFLISEGDTPLHVALKNKQAKIAQYLFLKGARSDIWNSNQQSPFIYACENKYKEFVQFILSLENISFPQEVINKVDLLCTINPLHFVCQNGYLQVVQFLIDQGADIEARDEFERTPLHYACESGHLPVAQYLIQKGANIEAKNRFQETPLHAACKNGYLLAVQYFIDKGADIQAKSCNGSTPLHKACQFGHLQIVQYLIEKGANIEAIDDERGTPLHRASCFGKIHVLKYLVSKGANKYANNKKGQTPYDVACDSIPDKLQKGRVKELLK